MSPRIPNCEVVLQNDSILPAKWLELHVSCVEIQGDDDGGEVRSLFIPWHRVREIRALKSKEGVD